MNASLELDRDLLVAFETAANYIDDPDMLKMLKLDVALPVIRMVDLNGENNGMGENYELAVYINSVELKKMYILIFRKISLF